MDTAPLSDAALIAGSRTDPEQFGTIFDRHFAALYRFFERRLGRSEADALTGEVFRIAFEQRHRYAAGREDCRPWLYGIAANLVRRHHRRHARHLRALGRLQRPAGDVGVDWPAVDHRLDSEAAWPQVAAALAALREAEQEVVLLVAWEGLTYDEVADALGVPVGTVRSRLSRARQKLRERLGPSGEEPVERSQPAPGRSGR